VRALVPSALLPLAIDEGATTPTPTHTAMVCTTLGCVMYWDSQRWTAGASGRQVASAGLRMAIIGASTEARAHPMWSGTAAQYQRISGVTTVTVDYVLANHPMLPGKEVRIACGNRPDVEGRFAVTNCSVASGSSMTITYADARPDRLRRRPRRPARGAWALRRDPDRHRGHRQHGQCLRRRPDGGVQRIEDADRKAARSLCTTPDPRRDAIGVAPHHADQQRLHDRRPCCAACGPNSSAELVWSQRAALKERLRDLHGANCSYGLTGGTPKPPKSSAGSNPCGLNASTHRTPWPSGGLIDDPWPSRLGVDHLGAPAHRPEDGGSTAWGGLCGKGFKARYFRAVGKIRFALTTPK
jgi:hypothetical protein